MNEEGTASDRREVAGATSNRREVVAAAGSLLVFGTAATGTSRVLGVESSGSDGTERTDSGADSPSGSDSDPDPGSPTDSDSSSDSVSDPDLGPERSTSTIMAGTAYETELHVIESEASGPTGFVVAGQHGIENAGWEAAHVLREMAPERGTLVVLPEADRTAIRASTYSGDGGDLNRQWPAGSAPTSDLAREIWTELEGHDPDVVLDLHSSHGIYGGSPSGVGQAIFPTSNAGTAAEAVIDELNDEHVEPAGYDDDFLFTRGNDQTGANPLLSHKVGADTDAYGFLFEPTRYETDLPTRVDWTVAAAVSMLREGGLVLE